MKVIKVLAHRQQTPPSGQRAAPVGGGWHLALFFVREHVGSVLANIPQLGVGVYWSSVRAPSEFIQKGKTQS